jgi:hypothetical protein
MEKSLKKCKPHKQINKLKLQILKSIQITNLKQKKFNPNCKAYLKVQKNLIFNSKTIAIYIVKILKLFFIIEIYMHF